VDAARFQRLGSRDTTSAISNGVDRAERRSRQRDEKSWMRADDDGCALAANESGGHENPGVSSVEVRARWTDDFTPVFARYL